MRLGATFNGNSVAQFHILSIPKFMKDLRCADLRKSRQVAQAFDATESGRHQSSERWWSWRNFLPTEKKRVPWPAKMRRLGMTATLGHGVVLGPPVAADGRTVGPVGPVGVITLLVLVPAACLLLGAAGYQVAAKRLTKSAA
jgi:hypothetical protein